MGNFDILTLVFLALAVFVIFKLRSVLGERTGAEPPSSPYRGVQKREAATPPVREENALPGPAHEAEATEAGTPAFRWQGYAQEGTPLAAGFDAIAAIDPSFDPKSFTQGAKAAYEMIVTAFNNGDRKSLKGLLSREMFDTFSQHITERESHGETVESSFVSIDKAEIAEAAAKGRVAELTVNFVSQVISATKDKNGALVEGSPDKVTTVSDSWTFSRDTGTRDPNWRLVSAGNGE